MDTQQSNIKSALTPTGVLRFIVPSILSLILFLVPFSIDGNNTILVAVLAQFLNEQLTPFLPVLILLIATSSAALATICTFRRTDTGLLGELFGVSWPWLCLRIIGAVIAVLVFFEAGPEAVWGASTGQTMVGQLVPTVMTLFLAVIFLLPLMTEYGIMEFAGVLLSRFFGLLFRLPGRGAIDAMASWLGAAPLGALVTTIDARRLVSSRVSHWHRWPFAC
jgi:nucleoside recognition membrane protein YjiH